MKKIYYGTSEGIFKHRYETIRNHSVMKCIGQIQNSRRNTEDLKNSKQSLNYNFTF